jgi:hypothetical protein
MSGPLPVQVCTWLFERSGYDGTRQGVSDGQWLYCLKSTRRGDRQAVWSGIDGRGIIAVVDFSGDVRLRTNPAQSRLYEGWGRITALPKPVSVLTAQRHGVLKRCFGRSVQGVQRLDPEVARAIRDCVGGLPPAAGFRDHGPDWDALGGDWSAWTH